MEKGRKDGKGAKGRKGGKRHGEMKAFKNEKIKPIMLEQRVKLESKISDADKVTLAQLRVDIKKDRAEYKAKRKAYRKSSDKKERPDQAEMEKRKAERKNNPNRIKVLELVEKYKAEIEPLITEVEPKIKALKEEMKAECGGDCGGKGGKGSKGRKGAKGKKDWNGADKGAYIEKRKNKRYAHFLLLDPNEDVKVKAKKRPGKSNASISKVKVYPNPSQGISQIEYELKTPGMVSVELHDKEGNLIETVEKAEKPAGKHKTSINFGNYTVGVYYVVLKDETGNIVSRKVIR